MAITVLIRGRAGPGNNRCLSNWATVVWQKEEPSTYWISLYSSYSHLGSGEAALLFRDILRQPLPEESRYLQGYLAHKNRPPPHHGALGMVPTPILRKPLRTHARKLKTSMFDVMPTETKVDGGTCQSKSGTSANLSNSGIQVNPLTPRAT